MQWRWFFFLIVALDVLFVSLVVVTTTADNTVVPNTGPQTDHNNAQDGSENNKNNPNSNRNNTQNSTWFSHEHTLHIKISIAFATTITVLTISQFLAHTQQQLAQTKQPPPPPPPPYQQQTPQSRPLPPSSSAPNLLTDSISRTSSHSSLASSRFPQNQIPRNSVPERFRASFDQYEKVRAYKFDVRAKEIAKRWVQQQDPSSPPPEAPPAKDVKLIAKHVVRLDKQNQALAAVVDSLLGEISRDVSPVALDQLARTMQPTNVVTGSTQQKLRGLLAHVRQLRTDNASLRTQTAQDITHLSSLTLTSFQRICRTIAHTVISSTANTTSLTNSNSAPPSPRHASSFHHQRSKSCTLGSANQQQQQQQGFQIPPHMVTHLHNTLPALRGSLSDLRVEVGVLGGFLRVCSHRIADAMRTHAENARSHAERVQRMEVACRRIFELQEELEKRSKAAPATGTANGIDQNAKIGKLAQK